MNWIQLNTLDSFDKLLTDCFKQDVVLFKHSGRCSISSMIKNRIESKWQNLFGDKTIYLIDVINNRDISNYVADKISLRHESPQLIILKEGNCIYHASHMSISPQELANSELLL